MAELELNVGRIHLLDDEINQNPPRLRRGLENLLRETVESHAETASGTMQVVGLGCARRGHDGLHRLDAALNLLPERYLVEMRRRVTIATAAGTTAYAL